MSILETTLIFVGIPLLITVIFGGLSYIGSKYPGPVPAENPYTLDRKWEYGPVLWSATDEPIARGHHGHHGHVAGAPAELIGGTASGKW
ncbi:aa3-type cytochrome oxidase subunit CtaJ [Rhodococcus chondri]|uniref:Uncharacterized protein n=1 Tax=Rhodococcus chondri TaxID=3065941 RepID=A0ABU7JQU0_9NOCA|nr:hypothetical protein [Rhodococcus sp. CC-R104]MEE2031859.1 hypothetical protein [Rhodococcus sp. CC-R104]